VIGSGRSNGNRKRGGLLKSLTQVRRGAVVGFGAVAPSCMCGHELSGEVNPLIVLACTAFEALAVVL
jgi:hypothetical protein